MASPIEAGDFRRRDVDDLDIRFDKTRDPEYWRPVLNSRGLWPRPCSSAIARCSACSASCAACFTRSNSISCAEIRSIGVSYFPATCDRAMITLRSSFVIGPNYVDGGLIRVRSTTPDAPFLIRKDVTASPTPTSRIAFSVENLGLSR